MRTDYGFAALARAVTAPPTVVNVTFAPKAARGGCFAWVGFVVVLFAIYCAMRFA